MDTVEDRNLQDLRHEDGDVDAFRNKRALYLWVLGTRMWDNTDDDDNENSEEH